MMHLTVGKLAPGGLAFVVGTIAACAHAPTGAPDRAEAATVLLDADPSQDSPPPDAAPEPADASVSEPAVAALPPVTLAPTPAATAPAGRSLVAGPGFAFLVPADSGAVTFAFVVPGTDPVKAPLLSVTLEPFSGDGDAAVAEAVGARKGSYSEVLLHETEARLSGVKAVELETEAPSYRGHGLERHAAVEGTLVSAACRTEEAPFEPVRQICLAGLGALQVAKAPPSGPSVTAKGVHVTVPPGLEPRGAAVFRSGTEDLTRFMDMRLTSIPWADTLEALAEAPLGIGYVIGAPRRTTKRGPGGVSLYEDVTTAGGAPVIRRLRRLVIAGGRGYAIDCETDVGSFAAIRRQCQAVIDSLVVAP